MQAQRIDMIDLPTQKPRITDRQTPSADNTGRHYGYISMSEQDCSDEDQRKMLHAAGVADEDIFLDEFMGRDCEQSEYQTLLDSLRAGDTLIVKSFDKLGRTYDDVIAQWQLLTKDKRVHVAILDIPLLDTRVHPSEICSEFLSDLVMQFLSYVSVHERESIRQRQHEGILAARERGVRFGRPPKPIPSQFDMVLKQWHNKEISSRKAAKRLGVAQETFLRWARRRESEQAR